MESILTADVKEEYDGLTHKWLDNHLKAGKGTLKENYAEEFGLKRFELVNHGLWCSFSVARVREGVTHFKSLTPGGHPPEEEFIIEACKHRMISAGMVTGRQFAHIIMKIDKVSLIIFSKKGVSQKSVSVSGPSHIETGLDAISKFFYFVESMRPPPLPGSERLPRERDHYQVFVERYWQTNQVATVNFGDQKLIAIDKLRKNPLCEFNIYSSEYFRACNIYPLKDQGFSMVSVFHTGKCTFLHTEDLFYLTFKKWIEIPKAHLEHKEDEKAKK